jgi:hypothetical protein
MESSYTDPAKLRLDDHREKRREATPFVADPIQAVVRRFFHCLNDTSVFQSYLFSKERPLGPPASIPILNSLLAWF